jgi:hypothetical protein
VASVTYKVQAVVGAVAVEEEETGFAVSAGPRLGIKVVPQPVLSKLIRYEPFVAARKGRSRVHLYVDIVPASVDRLPLVYDHRRKHRAVSGTGFDNSDPFAGSVLRFLRWFPCAVCDNLRPISYAQHEPLLIHIVYIFFLEAIFCEESAKELKVPLYRPWLTRDRPWNVQCYRILRCNLCMTVEESSQSGTA